MKKIVFSGVLQLNNSGVSEDQIRNAIYLAISLYGRCPAHIEVNEVTSVDEMPDASYVPAWLYISPDESEPYFLAGTSEKLDMTDAESDIEVGDELMDAIRKNGVCMGLVGKYPRADRYGSPGYMADSSKGELLAAFHGLTITKEQFFAEGYDRKDDGAEQLWLKVLVPPELGASLEGLYCK